MPPTVQDVYIVLGCDDVHPPVSRMVNLLRQCPNIDAVHLVGRWPWMNVAAFLELKQWRVFEAHLARCSSARLKAAIGSFRGQYLSLAGIFLLSDAKLQSHLSCYVQKTPPSTLGSRTDFSEAKTFVCPTFAVGAWSTLPSSGFTELIVVQYQPTAGAQNEWFAKTFSTGASWMRVESCNWHVASAGGEIPDCCILDADVVGLPLEVKLRFSRNWLARWTAILDDACGLPADLVLEIADLVFDRARALRLRRGIKGF